MKKLHLTGFTPGNDGLVLSPRKGAKSGGFVVSLDDTLVAAIELARRRRDGEELGGGAGAEVADTAVPLAPLRPRSSLSPREIQARLRAGSTISEVASQAGVDDEWVARFADPILAEQAQVVESAQRLTFAKARRGPSIERLAPSVQWNLSDRGVRFSDDVFADCWSAYNLHGARWAVRFVYTSRKRRQVAEWEVDLRERSLTARNRLAADLGHVEAGRRRPSVEPPDPGATEAGPSGTTAQATSGTRGHPRKPARPARTVADVGTQAAASAVSSPGRPGGAGAKRSPAPGRPGSAAAKKAGARSGGAAAVKKVAPAGRSGTAAAEKPSGVRRPGSPATAAAGRRTTAAAASKPPVAKRGTLRAAASTVGRKAAGTKAAGTKAAGIKVAGAKAGGTKAGTTKAGTTKAGTTKVGGTKATTTRTSVAKGTSRQPSSRKARPAKKAAGDSPAVAPAPDTSFPDRPSHLARPPSPMKAANRATSYPSQRLTSSYARPAPPAPVAPPSPAPAAPRSVAPPAEPANPTNPRFELAGELGRRADEGRAAPAPAPKERPPESRPPPPAAAAPDPGRTGARATVATPIAGQAQATTTPSPRSTPAARRPPAITPEAADERPAVVILSTPTPTGPAEGGDEEGRARLVAADRLRAAYTSPPPQGPATRAATEGGRPRGRTPRPGASGQGTAGG